MPCLVGAIVRGRYRLERHLAQGGMGSVWAAWDISLERRVALKFMIGDSAGCSDRRARFEREAKAAAKLRTPHVVQVFEHGVEAGVPFMVMELLDGEDLGKRLRRRGRLSVWEVSSLASGVARALRHAHEAALVHRDLKPQNIFVAREDDLEIVKVLDFGVAKWLAAEDLVATKTGEVIGSVHYMSPEQARGLRTVDLRSDLWSFGVILYRCLTGKRPFVGESAGDIVYKICTASIVPPSQLVPGLPSRLDAFMERALAKEPAARFQSAAAMCGALRAALAEEPREALGSESGTASSATASSVAYACSADAPPARSAPADGLPEGVPLVRATVPSRARHALMTAGAAVLIAAGVGLSASMPGRASLARSTPATASAAASGGYAAAVNEAKEAPPLGPGAAAASADDADPVPPGVTPAEPVVDAAAEPATGAPTLAATSSPRAPLLPGAPTESADAPRGAAEVGRRKTKWGY
ncbi:MAG: protein kinase [Polyangiaceae bacterium]